MTIYLCVGLAAALFIALPAAAADDTGLERLTTCRDSWVDWQKTKAPQLTSFAAHLRNDFTHKDSDAFIVPKSAVTLDGFRVLEVYPESVGMGVGFSVTLAAPFDKAKKMFEAKLGKTLAHCETSDGMKSCEIELGPQRTFMLMSSDKPGDPQTLAGCYYYYER
jgi:hypothetical protein